MKRFVITAEGCPKVFQANAVINDAEKAEFDFSPWADDDNNDDVTAVSWSVESGTAAISGEALANNVASAVLTFSSAGRALIKAIATAGTQTFVAYLDVLIRDPQVCANDYAPCC